MKQMKDIIIKIGRIDDARLYTRRSQMLRRDNLIQTTI